MATTTNYGWTTPDDTALVKDGAAAIRSLGTAIDTTVFNNAGAAIAKTLIDAEGDLIVGDAADAVQRLAIGSNGNVLTVDTTVDGKIKWAAPSSGGMTLVNTGGTTLTGSSITISSIPATYKHLYISVKNVYASTIADLRLRLNSDTGSNYTYSYTGIRTSTHVGNAATTTYFQILSYLGSTSGAANEAFMDIWIPNYTDTNGVFMNCRSIGRSNYQADWTNGIYANSAAINSITLLPDSGTFSGGTAYVYGVS